MTIAVTSIHDDNYSDMAEITWTNNKVPYCERWGYDPIVKTTGFDPNVPIGFEKIILIRDVLERRQHQWVYWCGCDTLITNWHIPLTQFTYDDAHFIIASDFNGLNADSFLVRNSPQGRNYIDMILQNLPAYRHNNLYEQGVMIDTYQQNRSVVKVIPQKSFNSYVYDMYRTKGARNNLDCLGFNGDWSVGDFLCHCPDHPKQVRIDLFKKLEPLVIK